MPYTRYKHRTHRLQIIIVALAEGEMAQQMYVRDCIQHCCVLMQELPRPSTAFVDAFKDYLYNLPEKKRNKNSILSHINVNSPPTPESIQKSIEDAETKNSNKSSSKIMKKVLSPVIRVLKDYYGVIDTLGSPLTLQTLSDNY